MARKYEVADMIRLSASFTVNGVATDPTTVTLKIMPDGGSETVYEYGTDPELEKESVGNYFCDFAIPSEGDWYYKWYGTGDAYAAKQGSFEVIDSYFE